MGIKESALSAITSITQSDYVRAVTSAGASRKITLSNLAKAIVESYTGSSLAGSSQSVKAAIDSLNSKTKLYTLYKSSGNNTTMTLTVTGAANGYSVFFTGRVGNNSASGADYGIIVLGNNNDCTLKHESSVSLSVSRSGEVLTFTMSSTYSTLMFMSMLPLS